MCRKGRFHSVSAGLTRMPALKANTLRIRSPYLLMRNPGLSFYRTQYVHPENSETKKI